MTLNQALRLIETIQRHTEWRNVAVANDIAEVKGLIVKAIKALQEAVDGLEKLEEDFAHDIDINPEEVYYGNE